MARIIVVLTVISSLGWRFLFLRRTGNVVSMTAPFQFYEENWNAFLRKGGTLLDHCAIYNGTQGDLDFSRKDKSGITTPPPDIKTNKMNEVHITPARIASAIRESIAHEIRRQEEGKRAKALRITESVMKTINNTKQNLIESTNGEKTINITATDLRNLVNEAVLREWSSEWDDSARKYIAEIPSEDDLTIDDVEQELGEIIADLAVNEDPYGETPNGKLFNEFTLEIRFSNGDVAELTTPFTYVMETDRPTIHLVVVVGKSSRPNNQLGEWADALKGFGVGERIVKIANEIIGKNPTI